MTTKRTEAVGNSNHPVKASPSSNQSYKQAWNQVVSNPTSYSKGPGFDTSSRCWLSQVFLGDHQATLHKFWQAGHLHPLPHPYQFSLHLQPSIWHCIPDKVSL